MQEPNPFTFNSIEEYLSALKKYHEWVLESEKQEDEAIARIRNKRAAEAIHIFLDWMNPCGDNLSASLEERGLRTDAPDEAKKAYADFLAIQKKRSESGS
jgi:hypothetical protein